MQEQRRGNVDAAVNLAKQIVRGACANEHWWLRLAELLAETGHPEDSILALDALHGRSSHAVTERLRSKDSPLRKLAGTRKFQTSALAAGIEVQEGARRKRVAEARARLENVAAPPGNYVARRACPFECCRFGKWKVTEDTALYDKAGGTVVVGRLTKGQSVTALTGEVHLRPVPVRAHAGTVPGGVVLQEGQIVFLLDHLGEGYRHIWMDGKIVSGFDGVRRLCPAFSVDCWGEFLEDESDVESRPPHVWWVRIRLGAGAAGWTRETGHFSGADGCG